VLTGGPAPRVPHATLIDALAAVSGRASAVLLDGQEQEHALRWELVYTRARRLAAALAREGVRAGDRVILVLPTGVDFLDAFFGTLVLGAVPVPLYPPVRLGRLEEYHAATARMISAVGGRIVLTDARVSRLLGVALERARPPLGLRQVAELLAEVGTEELEPAGRAEDLALIQFSSGSTVDPKPVMLTHTNVLSQCAMVSALIPEPGNPDAAGVSWLPLYHDMGLIGGLLTAVYHGGNIVLVPPEQFLARPGRVAARAEPPPRHHLAGPQLRLRRGRAARDRRRAGGRRSVGVALRAVRRRAGVARRDAPLRRALRALRLRRARADAGVRALRGGARRSPSPVPGREAHRSRSTPTRSPPGRVRPGTASIASVGARRCPAPRWRCATPTTAPRRWRGGPRPGRAHPSMMQGYFGQAEATARALRRRLARHRRPRLRRRRRALTLRPRRTWSSCAAPTTRRRSSRTPSRHVEGLRPGCAVALGYAPADTDGEQLLVLAEAEAALRGARMRRAAEAVPAAPGCGPTRSSCSRPGTLPRTSSGKLRRSRGAAALPRRHAERAREGPADAGPRARRGARCAQAAARLRALAPDDVMWDVAVVGAGPAGLAVAHGGRRCAGSRPWCSSVTRR
jgi:fatty-acyl-CoA synthase